MQDGFHLYRAELDKFSDPVEAFARRGAPYTFDTRKYLQVVKSLKDDSTVIIYAPSFDHNVKGRTSYKNGLKYRPGRE